MYLYLCLAVRRCLLVVSSCPDISVQTRVGIGGDDLQYTVG